MCREGGVAGWTARGLECGKCLFAVLTSVPSALLFTYGAAIAVTDRNVRASKQRRQNDTRGDASCC